jgi:hypothetical protein
VIGVGISEEGSASSIHQRATPEGGQPVRELPARHLVPRLADPDTSRIFNKKPVLRRHVDRPRSVARRTYHQTRFYLPLIPLAAELNPS